MKTVALILFFIAKTVLLGTGSFLSLFPLSGDIPETYYVYFPLLVIVAVLHGLIVRKASAMNRPFGTLLAVLLILDPFFNDYTQSIFTLGAYLFCLLPLFLRLCLNGGKKAVLVLSGFTSAAAAALMPVSIGGFVLFSNLTLCCLMDGPFSKKLLYAMLPGTLASTAGCCFASLYTIKDEVFSFFYRLDYFSTAIVTLNTTRFQFSLSAFTPKTVFSGLVAPVLAMAVGFLLASRLKAGCRSNSDAFRVCRAQLLVLAAFTAFGVVFAAAVKCGFSPVVFQGAVMLLIFFNQSEVGSQLAVYLRRNARYLLPLLILLHGACVAFTKVDNSIFDKIIIYF